jgi:zinc D-Ala-D-Ala carboxypeptidase
MRLSPHFTLEEFTLSQTASRFEIRNIPGPRALERLKNTSKQMEKVRSLLGDFPIFISSGYRSPTLNSHPKVGGSKTSAHCKGDAADWVCRKYGSNYKAACAVRDSGIEYDQLILEYGWIHLGFGLRMRQQELTKRSAAAPWENGINK